MSYSPKIGDFVRIFRADDTNSGLEYFGEVAGLDQREYNGAMAPVLMLKDVVRFKSGGKYPHVRAAERGFPDLEVESDSGPESNIGARLTLIVPPEMYLVKHHKEENSAFAGGRRRLRTTRRRTMHRKRKTTRHRKGRKGVRRH
jgi:hypothetical protein